MNDNKVHDLNSSKKKIQTDKKKKIWIRWEISNQKKPLSNDLIEILGGDTIVFQYYLPDGEIKETVFDLSGVDKAFQEILKLPEQPK